MWQNFLDLWSSSNWFRYCLVFFIVGLYVCFLK